MARIAEYEAKDVKLNPSELGETANTQAARRIGSFFEQMASGAKEIGRLQQENDDEIGKQLTAFLRFKGLEDASSGVNVRTGKSGVERTLIGTGSGEFGYENARANYQNLLEQINGPGRLSRLAAQTVAQASPIQDTVEHGVNVLRGSRPGSVTQSDIENGVTVLRGSSKLASTGQDWTNPKMDRDQLEGFPSTVGGQLSPYLQPGTAGQTLGQEDQFPLPFNNPIGGPSQYPDAQSVTAPDSTTPETPPNQDNAPSMIPTEQSDAPTLWHDLTDNMASDPSVSGF